VLEDKTGSLPVSFPVQIIYRMVSYRDIALLVSSITVSSTNELV